MKCSKCGLDNQVNAQFCSYCGNVLEKNDLSDADQRSGSKSNTMLLSTRWKRFSSSWYMFAVIVLYSVLFFWLSREAISIFGGLSESLDQLSENHWVLGLMQSVLFFQVLVSLQVPVALEVLTLVALWMIFISGKIHSAGPISTEGLNVLRIRYIVGTVLSYLPLVAYLVEIFVKICTGANDIIYSIEGSYLGFLVILAIAVYNHLWQKLVSSAYKAIESNVPNSRHTTPIIAILISLAVLCFIALLIVSELNYVIICSALLPIMFAILVIQYRAMMQDMEQEASGAVASSA